MQLQHENTACKLIIGFFSMEFLASIILSNVIYKNSTINHQTIIYIYMYDMSVKHWKKKCHSFILIKASNSSAHLKYIQIKLIQNLLPVSWHIRYQHIYTIKRKQFWPQLGSKNTSSSRRRSYDHVETPYFYSECFHQIDLLSIVFRQSLCLQAVTRLFMQLLIEFYVCLQRQCNHFLSKCSKCLLYILRKTSRTTRSTCFLVFFGRKVYQNHI